ncbi:hypothetical protein HPB50_025960 [Hyalomma asiaticum]|uniref:Uncharacterized protein n=1 Tax=Hyalomma asiaticum TaxID=266040 RepID=A0ACB7T1H6_HYAAI|nr:hypothetical protein HPB50_025960 [Hyalomma asiaticum]
MPSWVWVFARGYAVFVHKARGLRDVPYTRWRKASSTFTAHSCSITFVAYFQPRADLCSHGQSRCKWRAPSKAKRSPFARGFGKLGTCVCGASPCFRREVWSGFERGKRHFPRVLRGKDAVRVGSYYRLIASGTGSSAWRALMYRWAPRLLGDNIDSRITPRFSARAVSDARVRSVSCWSRTLIESPRPERVPLRIGGLPAHQFDAPRSGQFFPAQFPSRGWAPPGPERCRASPWRLEAAAQAPAQATSLPAPAPSGGARLHHYSEVATPNAGCCVDAWSTIAHHPLPVSGDGSV